MLKDKGLSFEGQTVVVSGSGNVAIYAIEKAMQLGAKVVACSDSNGYIYDKNGIDLDTVKRIKEVERKRISEYVNEHPDADYFEGCENIWLFLVILLFHVQLKMKLMKHLQKFLLQMV